MAAGYNWHYTPTLELGLMAGYIAGDFIADSPFVRSWDSSAHGWFAGLNGRSRQGGFFLDFGVVGGGLHHQQDRFVNHNLALTDGLTLGIGGAEADYSSWFASPETTIGADYHFAGWTFTPSLGARYAAQWLDKYLYEHRAPGCIDFGRFLHQREYRLDCRIESDSTAISVDQALNLAVAVNELVLNTRKHSYDGKDGGVVTIICQRNGAQWLHLAVADGGKGLPANFSADTAAGLGLSIVASIERQLQGELISLSGQSSA
jgi:hypothetical protein